MTLRGRARGVAVRSQLFRLPQAESKLKIVNGRPGLTRVDVIVNGRTFRFRNLRSGQRRSANLAVGDATGQPEQGPVRRLRT